MEPLFFKARSTACCTACGSSSRLRMILIGVACLSPNNLLLTHFPAFLPTSRLKLSMNLLLSNFVLICPGLSHAYKKRGTKLLHSLSEVFAIPMQSNRRIRPT